MNRTVVAVISIFVALFGFAAVSFSQDAPPPLTRANWAEQVGFKPNLEQPGFEPGVTIEKTNADQFAAILTHTAMTMVKKYGMKIETHPYKPYAPSDGFIAATNKNRGKASLAEIGDAFKERELIGFEGGMPFPAPKNGREIAWNYMLAYGGDDSKSEFNVYWISPKSGVERKETWKTIGISRAKYRTDIPPLPEVPELVKKGVIAATLTQAIWPPDKKGYASLYYGYLEPREPNGWLYLPPQRRSIRLTFGQRGEAWNNTDLLYEDVRGYTGSPEWMNWKLVEKTTMLLPIRSGVVNGKGKEVDAFDFENAPHWNPIMSWELRPVYIVEATPKFKGYPYSRMVFYIDAESSHILAKSAYDRKGELWKLLLHAGNESEDPTKKPGKVALLLVIDVQAEHATAMFWHSQSSNIGADPKLFNMTTLRKMGK
jgi:Protein of unknown function (DUF1329)